MPTLLRTPTLRKQVSVASDEKIVEVVFVINDCWFESASSEWQTLRRKDRITVFSEDRVLR